MKKDGIYSTLGYGVLLLVIACLVAAAIGLSITPPAYGSERVAVRCNTRRAVSRVVRDVAYEYAQQYEPLYVVGAGLRESASKEYEFRQSDSYKDYLRLQGYMARLAEEGGPAGLPKFEDHPTEENTTTEPEPAGGPREPAPAVPGATPEFADAYPTLVSLCTACHGGSKSGPDEPKGDFWIGNAMLSGDEDDIRIKRDKIIGKIRKGEMPPGREGHRLDPETLDKIEDELHGVAVEYVK